MGEVEFDPVAVRDADSPHDELVVGVWLGEVGGGEVAILLWQHHAQRHREEGEQEKHAAPAGRQ